LEISRSKTTAATITLFLILTIAATFMTVVPNANAAVNYYHEYVYASAGNSVIGVGQSELLIM
jgi:hypothetical protein